MRINLSPLNSTRNITASVSGDVITINDEEFDFAFIPEEASLPAIATDSEHFSDEITRINGVINVTLFLPYAGGGYFECPPYIDVEDGEVEFPTHIVEKTEDTEVTIDEN